MIRGAVMYLCRDGLTNCFFAICTMMFMSLLSDFFKCQPSFFRLEVLVWWLLSLWPCISLPVYHQDTSSPSVLWRAVLLSPRTCHTLLWPSPHWSTCGSALTKPPLLVYGWGHYLVHGPSMVHWGVGRIIFWTFSCLSSSVIFGHLSSTGFKKPSRNINLGLWVGTAPLMTVWSVVLSVILANVLMLAQNDDRCSWACDVWLNIAEMKAISSAHHVLSGSWWINSGLDGISSGGFEDIDSSPWWGVVRGKLQWGPLWCGEQHWCLHPPSSPTALLTTFWNFWSSSPVHPSYLHVSIWKGGWKYCWSCLHTAGPLLDFVLQHQATLPLLHQIDLSRGAHPSKPFVTWCTGYSPKRGGQLSWHLQNKVQNGVFGGNCSLYRAQILICMSYPG